jgi:antitoxin (DNA-binding transcriptional repressor) of toxin-antitoxin stability system
MKTATVRDLRNEFGRVSQWLEAGETVQILKRGKPFARVVPEPKTRSLLGCMAGTAKLPPDIDEPVDVEWEAMK